MPSPPLSTPPSAATLLAGLTDFVNTLLRELDALGLTPWIRSVDHVCYRVASTARYVTLKAELAHHAQLITESMVNGRPIAVYRLLTPLRLANGALLDVLELPAPKPGRAYPEGFEHIEIVTHGSLAELLATQPKLPFNAANLHLAKDPLLELMTVAGLTKWHLRPLTAIIAEEARAARQIGQE